MDLRSRPAESAGARHAISAEIYPPHAIAAAILVENVGDSPYAISAAILAENVGDWVRRPAEFAGTTHAISDAITAGNCGELNSVPLLLPIVESGTTAYGLVMYLSSGFGT